MALTPEQLAELQRLKQMYLPLVEAQRRRDQAQDNAEKMGIVPPTAPNKADGGDIDAMRLALMNKKMPVAKEVPANKRMIDAVYSQYPEHPFNPNQRAMVEGEGEDQTLGTFELKPSMSARNAVELDWLSAYPHKQGVGSRTLKKLQEHAAEHGVSMTLFPWEHGGVSQAKLMKFYKKHGFVPTVKGGKAMIWHPESKAHGGLAHMSEGGSEDDYRGQHTAPGPHFGAPMHDVTRDMYPKDFYGPNGFRYYADFGERHDREAYDKVRRIKDKPDEMVSIHRAIPTSVYNEALKKDAPLKHMIRKGDWVAIAKQYAKEHGESVLRGDYKIASMRVPAKHVWTNGDSIHEWGYHPEEHKAHGGITHAHHLEIEERPL